ncbi:MAG: CRTAC1 family protein, partial [Planctomycetota bacterium]
NDGDLDLYVANYLTFSYATHVSATLHGFPIYADPGRYPPLPDTLYRNNADGTFSDVSRESGIGAHPGWGMGTVCADYDNDGDTDVFVANDVSENFLFQNDGNGKFEEVALMAGAAYDVDGLEHGSMGVDCADFDNDGLLDFHVTSYQNQLATLYRNLDQGFFEDATIPTGAGAGTLPYVTWGNGLVDLDNDGDRDLFIACGHPQDNVESFDDTSLYHTRNMVLMNTGDGKFVNVSDQCGDGLAVKLSSRGAGFDDLDNDGDIDVVILNSRREPTILRNDSATGNHWIQIRLRGTNTNRDGIGARVKVIAGDLTQIDEVHSGRGYQSHYGMRLHFGLGKRNRVDRIEVRWIGGGTDVLENVGADQLLIVTEGSPKAGGRN